jgi:hypothetical protein
MASRKTVVFGAKELDRKMLRMVDTGSKVAMVRAIDAGMRPIAKAMRAAVNASDASTFLKREARKSIGHRFKKNTRGRKSPIREAKVGFAVGKRKKSVQAAVKARGKRLAAGKGGGRGVGISAQNIHWFVLGTDERKHKSGHRVGRIANMFGQVTRLAFAGSAKEAVQRARLVIWLTIKRFAQKKG